MASSNCSVWADNTSDFSVTKKIINVYLRYEILMQWRESPIRYKHLRPSNKFNNLTNVLAVSNAEFQMFN
jgi:hypothetical protein